MASPLSGLVTFSILSVTCFLQLCYVGLLVHEFVVMSLLCYASLVLLYRAYRGALLYVFFLIVYGNWVLMQLPFGDRIGKTFSSHNLPGG